MSVMKSPLEGAVFSEQAQGLGALVLWEVGAVWFFPKGNTLTWASGFRQPPPFLGTSTHEGESFLLSLL